VRTGTIVVGRSFRIQDLDVKLNITHTRTSDLRIALKGPDGTTVRLVNRRGGSGANFRDTIFSDEAATPVAGGRAPFAGTYRPEAALSAFDRRRAAGTWTLIIQDLAPLEVGRLTSWSLLFETAPSSNISDFATSSTANRESLRPAAFAPPELLGDRLGVLFDAWEGRSRRERIGHARGGI
jgi:subtilisin-like proprotein convertase family protein